MNNDTDQNYKNKDQAINNIDKNTTNELSQNKIENLNNEQNSFIKVIFFVTIVIIIVALYFFLTSTLKDKPLVGRGSEVDRNQDSLIGSINFQLIDHKGNNFDGKNLLGKVSIVYFGFAGCPDVCPTSLDKITKVVNDLDKIGINTLPIFISLDPKRDTPDVLQKFVENYSNKIIGLTGDKDAIDKVASDFKVFFEKMSGSLSEDSMDYMINHTSLIYIMDTNGNYSTHFHLDSKPSEIVEYIRTHFSRIR